MGCCTLKKQLTGNLPVWPCSETRCGDWVLVGGMLVIIASIYQTPGQCHHFKWQHPMAQLLTRPVSAMLSRSVLGLCWKLSTGKKEADSRGLEFDPTLPRSSGLQDSSTKVKDKAVWCSLAVRKSTEEVITHFKSKKKKNISIEQISYIQDIKCKHLCWNVINVVQEDNTNSHTTIVL